jgi:DNA-binding transcriptional LysR family regulator
MDRLDAMRVFVAVAEEDGFASAARRLGMSPPAVTRAVSALEDRIGTRLLERTTRLVRLTEAGTRFFDDCKRILGEIDEAEASAAGSHTEPRGQIAVTAPVMFGRIHVAPVLFDFLTRYPHVTVRTLLVDRVVDLMEEGLDVAVRIAHLPDSSLSAVRVGAVRRVVCASPRYLRSRGTPRTPTEVAQHDAVLFSQATAAEDWLFASQTRAVRPRAQLVVNTADVAIAAAVAGHGLTRVLSYQIAPELKAGRLKIVLAEFEPPPLPIHIVHIAGRRASARVRALVDFMVERFRGDGSLNASTG